MVFAVPYFDDDLEDRICGRAEEPSEPLADVTWVSETPLHRASYEGSLSDVRQLLDQGANVNATATVRPERNELTPPQSEGVSPLHIATANIAVDGHRWEGITPLHVATLNPDMAVAELLLDRGADIHAVAMANGAWTMVHFALQSQRSDELQAMINFLISRGAQI